LGQLLTENQDYVVKQTAIWLDFRQQLAAQEVENNLVLQQIDSRYQQAISGLWDLQDPQLAKFIFTLIYSISLNQIDDMVLLGFAPYTNGLSYKY